MLQLSRTYSPPDCAYLWQAHDDQTGELKTFEPETSIVEVVSHYKKLGYVFSHRGGSYYGHTPHTAPRPAPLPLEWQILSSTPTPAEAEIDF